MTPSLHVNAQVVVPFLICSAMYSSYLLSLSCLYILYEYHDDIRPDLSIVKNHYNKESIDQQKLQLWRVIKNSPSYVMIFVVLYNLHMCSNFRRLRHLC